jgi:SAM-dependent methyltransferase
MAEYMLTDREQRQRLEAIEAWLDPQTIERLTALGVGVGWRCLEVGAGGGSIAAWLCQRVGPTGHVLATDLNTHFLDTVDAPNLTVLRHDIATDALLEGDFDLVHARALLEHVSARETALAKMVAALKPGGWLLAEAGDYSAWTPVTGDPQVAAFFARASAALLHFLPMDEFYGRHLAQELKAHRLVDVSTEGRVYMVDGSSSSAQIWRTIWSTLAEKIVAASVLTADELAAFIGLHDNPHFAWTSPIVMAAWGHRLLTDADLTPVQVAGAEKPVAVHPHSPRQRNRIGGGTRRMIKSRGWERRTRCAPSSFYK